MRTGRYSIGELFASRHLEQFVIPEIQRDYVWGSSQLDGLLTAILDNFKKWKDETTKPRVKLEATGDTDKALPAHELDVLKSNFVSFYAQRTWATNIGFIYAYCDADLPGQYALIDGQQRLTTIYLILLVLASLDKSGALRDRFCARYCLMDGEAPARQFAPTRLDYRLREETARFLRQFVEFALRNCSPENPSSEQVDDQSWYLQRDKDDPTVKNLIANYFIVRQRLMSDPKLNIPELYNYVEDLVECWYFDTNESDQGEELYLYLNARGESIADNENLKAELLLKESRDAEKAEWGRKWEKWQDYFWQHRRNGLTDNAENPNADRGFNSFLECIKHLEKLKDASEAPKQPILETIEKYVQVLQWLEKQRTPFAERFGYSGWVGKWFSELWGILNDKGRTDWSAAVGKDAKDAITREAVLVWGSLLCAAKSQSPANASANDSNCERIFRLIRFFYLRYHNHSLSIASLPRLVDELFQGNPAQLKEEEERRKWDFLAAKTVDGERREYESVIWQIEDHPLNLDGSDVGALNLSHLVELDPQNTTLEHLQRVREKFFELFPLDEKGKFEPGQKQDAIAATLLYYGPFWQRKGPYYYENYDLGDWKRTIRDNWDREAQADPHVFKRFFQDFLASGQTVESFLSGKRGTVEINPVTTTELRLALIWYSEWLGRRLFEKGRYIARDSLPGTEKDSQFPNLTPLWNTWGDFRGSGNQRLSTIVPSEGSP